MKENAKKTPNTTAISKKTDASLEKMVKGICDHYDEWLDNEYRWPNRPNNCKAMNEQETVKRFYQFSTQLRNGKIEESIADIFKWGGGNSKQEQIDFANAIRKLKRRKTVEMDEILKMGSSPNSPRIAFWSKVLAAYKPGEYYIYDSRVALALSYISLKLKVPCFWSVPAPRGTTMQKRFKGFCGKTIKATIRDNLPDEMKRDPNSCYPLYLELLRRLADKGKVKDRYNGLSHGIQTAYGKMFDFIQDKEDRKRKSIMAHLEKMLFMMKEDIVV